MKEKLENHAFQLWTTACNSLNSQLKVPMQDAYQLSVKGSEYIMSEGYTRSKATGVGIIDPLPLSGLLRNIPLVSWAASWVPSIYVFSGTAHNLNAIAEYGEKNHDPKAREPHKRVQQATGATTIVNQLGAGAREEKKKIVKNLSSHAAFDYARELGTHIADIWDNSESLQDNITYVGAKIIGKSFLGIEYFPRECVPILREANDIIADGDANTVEFASIQ